MAVEEWITAGTGLHVMRDHPNHNYAMNAGMWGGVSGVITKEILEKAIGDMEKTGQSEYGDDQRFLRNVVYPLHSDGDATEHDSYSCKRWKAAPFPTKRSSNLQHVGQVFDGNNQPRMGDIDCCMRGKRNESPGECRKEPDWTHG